MKNDFDTVKDRFASDGINAPDDISEDMVLSQLEGVEPVKVKKKKTGMALGITSAAVASVAVITAGAFLATNIFFSRVQVGTPVSVSGTAKLMQFNTRDEVKKAVGNAKKFQNNINSGERYNALDGDVLEYGEKVFSAGSANGSASQRQARRAVPRRTTRPMFSTRALTRRITSRPTANISTTLHRPQTE